jgi:hypothetical protein
MRMLVFVFLEISSLSRGAAALSLVVVLFSIAGGYSELRHLCVPFRPIEIEAQLKKCVFAIVPECMAYSNDGFSNVRAFWLVEAM